MTEKQKLSERLVMRLGKHDCSITKNEVGEVEALEAECDELINLLKVRGESADREIHRIIIEKQGLESRLVEAERLVQGLPLTEKTFSLHKLFNTEEFRKVFPISLASKDVVKE